MKNIHSQSSKSSDKKWMVFVWQLTFHIRLVNYWRQDSDLFCNVIFFMTFLKVLLCLCECVSSRIPSWMCIFKLFATRFTFVIFVTFINVVDCCVSSNHLLEKMIYHKIHICYLFCLHELCLWIMCDFKFPAVENDFSQDLHL